MLPQNVNNFNYEQTDGRTNDTAWTSFHLHWSNSSNNWNSLNVNKIFCYSHLNWRSIHMWILLGNFGKRKMFVHVQTLERRDTILVMFGGMVSCSSHKLKPFVRLHGKFSSSSSSASSVSLLSSSISNV